MLEVVPILTTICHNADPVNQVVRGCKLREWRGRTQTDRMSLIESNKSGFIAETAFAGLQVGQCMACMALRQSTAQHRHNTGTEQALAEHRSHACTPVSLFHCLTGL